MQTTIFHIDDLCCGDEEILIRKKLEALDGIHETSFNLVLRKLTLSYSCSQEDIIKALRDIGFEPRLHYELDEPKTFWQRHNHLASTVLSGAALTTGLALSRFGIAETILIPIFLVSVISGGWRIAVKGFKAGKNLSLDMNVLMTLAALGAMAIGKWEESAAVMFLFTVANLLESNSMARTRKAMRSLMDVSPPTACVQRSGLECIVKVEEVAVGEKIFIRPGERIPLDGKVLAGDSTVDQAPITGESIPARKKMGDAVYAGTLNERGTLEVEVTMPYADTTLARIVRMVEEAQSERAPVQNFVDRFAHYYTPSVLAFAVMVVLIPTLLFHAPFGLWFYRALVLLVIACPCALVISTPVTIVSGLTNAARRGILIKGGRHLEELGRIKAIAFDKTGTLTKGTPRVIDVIPLNSISPREIIRLACAVEAKSEHHLAGAVLRKAYEEKIPFDNATYQHFETVAGRGVKAKIDGTTYIIGNHALIEEERICSPSVERELQRLEAAGKTAVIVGTEHEPLGIIAIADEVRADSHDIIRSLHSEGIQKAIMITGDNETTARAISLATGIDEFHAGILPGEKARRVNLLKERYGSVAMVGDGINDAPALAASTVGIAMGIAGTGVALETADVVLMSDDLSRLPYAMALSKKTLSIIRQNIAIAILTKLIFLGLGVFGAATLWMALLADDGAALVVILNGLRALRFKWNG